MVIIASFDLGMVVCVGEDVHLAFLGEFLFCFLYLEIDVGLLVQRNYAFPIVSFSRWEIISFSCTEKDV